MEHLNENRHRVVIYHDEIKEVPGKNLEGHILFFVPIDIHVRSETPFFGIIDDVYSPHKELADILEDCRREFNLDGKLHYSELSGQTWKKYDSGYQRTVSIAVDALRNKSSIFFDRPLNCKMAAIFYPKGADLKIYGGDSKKEKKLRHHETLLRTLIKGACHYLYDSNNPVEIVNLITDGEPFHRHLDSGRVLWRLSYDDFNGRTPLRDYVIFDTSAKLIHLSSDHKKYSPGSEHYVHANYLQVADLLLGSIIRSCYRGFKFRKLLPVIGEPCEKREIIAMPVKEIIEKKKRGAGFTNSGHYKSFVLTEVNFNRRVISFNELNAISVHDEGTKQIAFDFGEVGN